VSEDEPLAIMGHVVKHRSMADGTLRVEVDLFTPDDQTYERAVTRVARVGAALALARLSDEAASSHQAAGVTREDRGEYGQYAKELHRNGFFAAPRVWEAAGPDSNFLDWLTHQGCALADHGGCQGDVVAAHYRRVSRGSGTGHKPPYSAIPLCDRHHRLQHDQGYSALGDQDWWEKASVDYPAAWAKKSIKEGFGVDHLSQIEPGEFRAWAQANGLSVYLPRAYREWEEES